MNQDPSIAPPDEPDPELGRVIRRLREEQGSSQLDLATRSQVDPATLALIEDGAIDPPWATVRAIAQALGVPLKSIAEQRDDAVGR